jgi:ankyrin repeat protein
MLSRLLGTILVVLAFAGRPSFGAAIHDAARHGDLVAVLASLDQGVGVDAEDANGETPLMAAALAGHGDVVAALVKHGAKLDARNNRGLTALHAACYGDDAASVETLVQSGANVNDSDNKFKVTPLIIAAERDNPSVIQYLVAHGADLEAREKGGYTALSRAIFKNHESAAKTLLKSGSACQPEGAIPKAAADYCTKLRAASLP